MNKLSNWYEDKRFRRFWSHYSTGMNWIRRHKVAYWKARAKADEYENRAMRQYINYHLTTNTPRPETVCYYENHNNYNDEHGVESSDDEKLEIEMEITDDMLAFLETSDRHRQQLKAEKESLDDDTHEKTAEKDLEAPLEHPGIKRSTEMNILYGSKAPMIQAMETATQLSFNRNCDHSQPKYWPNLPLRL
ncbi:gem (nuclear organelle) associated protein 8 [Chamberlinius hualienensis]